MDEQYLNNLILESAANQDWQNEESDPDEISFDESDMALSDGFSMMEMEV